MFEDGEVHKILKMNADDVADGSQGCISVIRDKKSKVNNQYLRRFIVQQLSERYNYYVDKASAALYNEGWTS